MRVDYYDQLRARAYGFKMAFERLGGVNWEALRKARSKKEVKKIIAQADDFYRDRFLKDREPAILKANRDKRCPKTSRAYVKYLAVSLAGAEYGLSPRRSEIVVRKGPSLFPAPSRLRFPRRPSWMAYRDPRTPEEHQEYAAFVIVNMRRAGLIESRRSFVIQRVTPTLEDVLNVLTGEIPATFVPTWSGL
jgi:hypothetical protein